jgi:uncharacterized protein (DUF427 family)
MLVHDESALAASKPIVCPGRPRHSMVIEPLRGVATARVGGTVVARSERALLLKEVGRRTYEPVVYFPPGDVSGALLVPVDWTTRCPLKGTASYYDVETDNGRVARGAWSYKVVLDFDPRLTRIESCVAFDRDLVHVSVADRH